MFDMIITNYIYIYTLLLMFLLRLQLIMCFSLMAFQVWGQCITTYAIIQNFSRSIRSNDGIMPMVTTETVGNDNRYDRTSVVT
ncbi:unnamed protein product [Brassica oleracea]